MTNTTRAYSVATIKAADTEQRIIEGVASSNDLDRMGDVVVPAGAKIKTPLPLLWAHDATKPVGHVLTATPTASGINFTARIARIEEPGPLRDQVETAWQSVKSGLIRTVSIGFRAIAKDVLPSGGYKFKEWELLEISLVSIPANASAQILSVKAAADTARPIQIRKRVAGVPLIAPDRSVSATIAQLTQTEMALSQAQARLDTLHPHNPEFDAISKALPALRRKAKELVERKVAEDFGIATPIPLDLDADVSAMSAFAKRVSSQVSKRVTAKLEAQLTDLSRRLAEVEAKPSIQYRGVWRSQETYGRGDVVSYEGSGFVCKVDESHNFKPEQGGDWQLAIKRGRDGKDGK